MATTRAMLERRRASRVPIRIPVSVFCEDGDGQTVETPGLAVGVSRCGALLRVSFVPEVGTRIRVVTAISPESREFRVIRVARPKRDGTCEIGVEMLYPARKFWGVRFPDDRVEDPTEEVEVHQFPRG